MQAHACSSVKLAPPGGGSTRTSPGGSGGRRATQPSDAEAEIRQAIHDGDMRQALVLCARHYGALMGRLCMSFTGSQADAEDLTQETLLDAHKGFGSWRGDGSVRAWLLSIARRKCARHLEKKSRRTTKLRLVYDRDRDGPPSNRSEQAMLLKQRAASARAAIETLRPSEREALVLRYGSDLSYREVGEACGVDEAAARKRVSRAVAALRGNLQDQES